MALSEDQKRTGWFVAAILALGVFLHYDAGWQADAVRNDLTRSCLRANKIGDEVNSRSTVLKDFLTSAAEVREATARVERKEGDDKQAKLNEDVAKDWRENAAKVKDVAPFDCEKELQNGGIR